MADNSQIPVSDPISGLPMNKNSVLDPNEDALVNHLFGSATTATTKAFGMFQRPLLAGALAGLVLLPQADELIGKFIPATKNSIYTMIIAKIILVVLLFYIINNFALSRG